VPAKNTAFRIVSDSKGKVNVSAIAVFSEKKPYLHFSKDMLNSGWLILTLLEQ